MTLGQERYTMVDDPTARPWGPGGAWSEDSPGHVIVDLHALAATLTRVEAKIDAMAAKLEQLEAEFAPLARKWTGRAAALSATPAARFVKGRNRDQSDG